MSGPSVTTSPARALHEAGQSLWLDSINRVMLRSGDLARYVHEMAVTGLTSNPTILGHAMAASHDYDSSLRAWLAKGVSDPQDLVYAAAFEDLAEAAALFRPAWDATGGEDGYVSVEVPPDLAYDAPATLALAQRLHAMASFPNLLVKVPGTPQGLTVLEELVDAGIGVNVTLLFSDTHYLRTAEAYMRALERRLARGESLAVPSVASVFVSRWDKAADPLLPKSLHGRLGVALAQKVYASYRDLLASERWQNLEAAGARAQRVLWASTSTKDPGLPDTYYVEKLAAPGTIDTMPENTLLAFADHGAVGEMLRADYAEGEATVAAVAGEGVDVDALGESLQRQGARAFSADWCALLEAMAAKATALKAAA
jgi:transaldolase